MLWLANLDLAAGVTAVVVIRKQGAGGGKRRKGRWITIAGEYFKVYSAYEEQQLVTKWFDEKKQELLQAEAGTETKKAHYARVSFKKALRRLEDTTLAMELEQEFNRIHRIKDDELIILFLASL